MSTVEDPATPAPMPPGARLIDNYLTPSQAAAQIGGKASMIRSLCLKGKLRHYRVGLTQGRIYVKLEDLRAFLEASVVEPTVTKPPPCRIALRHFKDPGR